MASAQEITVMGAGIFGLACAWALVERGARVRVLDRAQIGAGASGGVVGALAPHVPEAWAPKKAFQLESLLAAEAFWARVAAVGGVDPGYARLGRLQPIPDEVARARADARAKEATTLWQGRATWRVIPIDAAPSVAPAGWAPISPSGWLIHDTLTARIAPARACQALAAALRAQGAEIVEGMDDPGAHPGPVLWATGAAGLSDLSIALDRPVGQGVKGQAALLDLDRRDAPQIYADGHYAVPHADGTMAVGSTQERTFDAPDTTDAQLDTVIATVRAAVPALADAPILRRWAGLRPRSRSRAPMLGPWPGRPGHFVANGAFTTGFGMAPGVARVMADLIWEGRDTIPEGFRVDDNM